MLLNCRLSFFFRSHITGEPAVVESLHPLHKRATTVRNNCNCLSFAPLSLGFNLAPRSSLHNVFVLEDAASCSQQGVLFFFSLSPFFPPLLLSAGADPSGHVSEPLTHSDGEMISAAFLQASRLRSR